MVGFGNLGNLSNLAQDAVKNLKLDDQKPSDQPANNDNKGSSSWADVGSDVKRAVGDFQDKQSKGEKPNYEELGNVAKKAYGTYGNTEGPKDPTSIGKAMVQGFMGNDKKNDPPQDTEPKHQDQQESKPEDQPPKPESQSQDNEVGAVGRMADRRTLDDEDADKPSRRDEEEKDQSPSWNKSTLGSNSQTGSDEYSGGQKYGQSGNQRREDRDDEDNKPSFSRSGNQRSDNEDVYSSGNRARDTDDGRMGSSGYGASASSRQDDVGGNDGYGSSRGNDEGGYGSSGREFGSNKEDNSES